jgi:hypothetical protein
VAVEEQEGDESAEHSTNQGQQQRFGKDRYHHGK